MNNFIDKGVVNSLLKGLGVLLLFAIVSVSFFYPVLQDKQIEQSDIVQYTGMAKEQNDFRSQTEEEPYWTNSAFGGMPTFQLGAQFPNNFIKSLSPCIKSTVPSLSLSISFKIEILELLSNSKFCS